VCLESERLLLLDRTTERALGLGSWGDDDLNVWGACGADLVLLRGIGSCEDLPVCCVDSCLDADEWLRGRDGGRDNGDGTEDSSFMLGCNGAGADGLGCVTGGPG
jgi:hypothetical protein